jgi:hypothetical protein
MSPEQARGKTVDKKADIWAFGVVLWEMLTGKRLFVGETVSDVLAAVLTREPDWAALEPRVQGRVRELLRRCLERNPKQRLHDIADARILLEEAISGTAGEGPVAAAPGGAAAVPRGEPPGVMLGSKTTLVRAPRSTHIPAAGRRALSRAWSELRRGSEGAAAGPYLPAC